VSSGIDDDCNKWHMPDYLCSAVIYGLILLVEEHCTAN
jgi:hypothetical protein